MVLLALVLGAGYLASKPAPTLLLPTRLDPLRSSRPSSASFRTRALAWGVTRTVWAYVALRKRGGVVLTARRPMAQLP